MLATTYDLANYMDLRFNNRQADAAELILAGVQGEIEAYLRRPVEPTTYTEVYIVPEDYLTISAQAYFYDRSLDKTGTIEPLVQPPYQLHLNNSPVIAVDEVRLKGRLDPQYRVLVEGRDYIATKWGIDTWAAWQHDRIEVTYTAGLDGGNLPYLKLMILRVASREMENQTDDVVGLKDLETNQVRAETVGLTEAEKAGLKRYRRMQV
jgi:hypothetical protein